MIIRRPHSRSAGFVPSASRWWTARRLARSISSSRSTSDSGAGDVAIHEGLEPDAEHLLAARRHLLERLDELGVGRDVVDELRQLGDRHAQVGHALEREVDVEDGEHGPQVGRHRGLPGE